MGEVVAQSADLASTIYSLSPAGNLIKIPALPTNQTISEHQVTNALDSLQGILKITSSVNRKLTKKESAEQERLVKEIKLEIELEKQIVKDFFLKNVYFLSELHSIFQDATIPPDPNDLKEVEEKEVALFRTELLTTLKSDSAIQKKVTISGIDSTRKDTVRIISFKYSVGKRFPFAISAGFIYNIGSHRDPLIQTSVTKDPVTGTIKIENISQPYQFVAGLHIYPFHKGLFLQDNRLLIPQKKYAANRISLYVGCAITNHPLDNLYLGGGYDIVPGLKLTAGPQFYRNDKVTISNNEILTRRVNYNYSWFIGINLDPLTLTKALISSTIKNDDKKSEAKK